MPSYLITGASRGIGLEFTRQLSAKLENEVFALVRNKAGATKLLELQTTTPNIHIVEADIVDYKALTAAAAEVTKSTNGKLDYLINNAAFIDDGERAFISLDNYPEGQEQLLADDLNKLFEINVVGVVHTINAFLPLIRAGLIKKVVSLSSGLADTDFIRTTGYALAAPYCISKAALNMVVAKYAARFKDEGVVFLALAPGLVDTSAKPPTPEQLEVIIGMKAKFKRAAPTWDERPITPEQSVMKMLSVLDKLTIEDSGTFVSQHGNREWL
ncbi:hypothetical protein B0H21DRAFT_894584 [Amylocystis lapponica]|nr:hypothetical protein B0H21DRAFT_894584 [Amylocystis lapponica]